MRLQLNWIQRGLLILAGAFFALLAFGTAVDHPDEKALGTAQFVLAFVFWVFAASPRSENRNAE